MSENVRGVSIALSVTFVVTLLLTLPSSLSSFLSTCKHKERYLTWDCIGRLPRSRTSFVVCWLVSFFVRSVKTVFLGRVLG